MTVSNLWLSRVFQLVLKPYHFAVFSVNLVAPNMEGTFAAEVIIVTQFEVRHALEEIYFNFIRIRLFIFSVILVWSQWNFAQTKTAVPSLYVQSFIVTSRTVSFTPQSRQCRWHENSIEILWFGLVSRFCIMLSMLNLQSQYHALKWPIDSMSHVKWVNVPII